MSSIKTVNDSTSISFLPLFSAFIIIQPGFIQSPLRIPYFLLLGFALYILFSKFKFESNFLKIASPFWLIFFFQACNSSLSLIFEFDSINLLTFLSKLLSIPICLITFYALYAVVGKNNLILAEFINRLYCYVGISILFFYLLQYRFYVILFNSASERSESLVRFSTPLGAGFTVFGSVACLYVIFLFLSRSPNPFYWIISFIMLLISAQRSAYVFLVLILARFAFDYLLFFRRFNLKRGLFVLTLLSLSAIIVYLYYPQALFSLQKLVLSGLNEFNIYDTALEYDAFSSSLITGDGGYLWRLYEYGSYLTAICWNAQPVSFIFFGCGAEFLGPEYGYLFGNQSHSTLWSLLLRLGIFQTAIVVSYSLFFYIKSYKPRLMFLLFLLFILYSSSGGLLVNPATLLLSIAIFHILHIQSFSNHHLKFLSKY